MANNTTNTRIAVLAVADHGEVQTKFGARRRFAYKAFKFGQQGGDPIWISELIDPKQAGLIKHRLSMKQRLHDKQVKTINCAINLFAHGDFLNTNRVIELQPAKPADQADQVSAMAIESVPVQAEATVEDVPF